MNKFNYDLIPVHMKLSIKYYIEEGSHIGSFLTALFSNDLFHAVMRADDENLALIPTYVCYIYNECPSGCHGSLQAIKDWQKSRRGKDE